MSDGSHFITIPRNNPVNALTMGGIVKDAGMSVEEFRNLLYSGELLESLKNDARLRVLLPDKGRKARTTKNIRGLKCAVFSKRIRAVGVGLRGQNLRYKFGPTSFSIHRRRFETRNPSA